MILLVGRGVSALFLPLGVNSSLEVPESKLIFGIGRFFFVIDFLTTLAVAEAVAEAAVSPRLARCLFLYY